MTTLQTVNLGPMVSSRRLFDLKRRLVPVEPTLSDMIAGARVALPALPDDAAGYRFLSMPSDQADALATRLSDMAFGLRRDYGRRYIDMRQGFDAYMAGFSGKTRSTLRRKCRKFAELSGGQIDIRTYHRADEIDRFFDIALPLSARTYQDRLLDAGLPADIAFREEARDRAARGDVRAFIMFVGERPVSYLYLPIDGCDGQRTLRYDYLGYDPDHAAQSPGTVLQSEAVERLMAEGRFAYFDFTSGEGAHKTLFGTDEVRCADFVALRATPANRLILTGLERLDTLVERGSAMAERIGIAAMAKRLLRQGG